MCGVWGFVGGSPTPHGSQMDLWIPKGQGLFYPRWGLERRCEVSVPQSDAVWPFSIPDASSCKMPLLTQLWATPRQRPDQSTNTGQTERLPVSGARGLHQGHDRTFQRNCQQVDSYWGRNTWRMVFILRSRRADLSTQSPADIRTRPALGRTTRPGPASLRPREQDPCTGKEPGGRVPAPALLFTMG